MYRIEVRPGEEMALRTVEELVIGIRNGVITPRARIWHNAGQKWLPIEFHPHYQIALRQVETGDTDTPDRAMAAAPPVTSSPPSIAPVASVEAAPYTASTPVMPSEPTEPPTRPPARRGPALTKSLGVLAVVGVVFAGAKLTMAARPWRTALAKTTSAATTAPLSAADSLITSALPSATTTPRPAAPRPADPPPAARPNVDAAPKAIVGGGVVLGPAQAPEPTPPTPSVEPAPPEDTIPSAPELPPVDLSLPAASSSPADAPNPTTDSLGR